ncbi:hypothetical protein FRB99_007713 [Tulasnella sp. 403]|nr:hypothetical protein FRB99_007713 [Tulasnella sp. 403]
MVSAARSEALLNPTAALQSLYTRQSGSLEDFPAVVSAHFAGLFQDEDAFREIPELSLTRPPSCYPPRSLVRFRGMVQDTLAQEVYATTIDVRGSSKLGGWGLADSVEMDETDLNIDYSKLAERSPLWVVSVPGESPWVGEATGSSKREVSTTATTAAAKDASTQPHKYPFNNPHLGIQVKVLVSDASLPFSELTTRRKVYSEHASFKPTQVVTFVGILSFDSLSVPYFDLDPSEAEPTLVPTIHTLFSRDHPKAILPFPYPLHLTPNEDEDRADPGVDIGRDYLSRLRDELISWISEEALCGDKAAAEWVLLVAVSRAFSTSGYPSALLDHNVVPFAPQGLWTYTKTNSTPIADLAPPIDGTSGSTCKPPVVVRFSRNVYAIDDTLPAGTLITVLETNVQEGRLSTNATENLHTLRDVLRTQTLHYKYPYSSGSGFEFLTDLACVVLCDGGKSKKSVFLPNTDITIPLCPTAKPDGGSYNPFKPLDEIALPKKETLDAFRNFVCGAMSGAVKVTESLSKYIQADFVKERSESASKATNITPDDLILRMNLVRLLALTYHETEVTKDMWDKVKMLDQSRRDRCTTKA